jgi:hypothetical protein
VAITAPCAAEPSTTSRSSSCSASRKASLAFTLEETGDRFTEATLDQRIAVGEWDAQVLSPAAGRPCLADAGEPTRLTRPKKTKIYRWESFIQFGLLQG